MRNKRRHPGIANSKVHRAKVDNVISEKREKM